MHPCIGAGVNLSIFYEKSGDLEALEGTTLAELTIDPFILGAGVGFRF